MQTDRDFYATRVRYALQCLGDERALASALNVDAADVRRWRDGQERPPTDRFLAMIDLLLNRQGD